MLLGLIQTGFRVPIMIVICTSKAPVHHSMYETRYRLHYSQTISACFCNNKSNNTMQIIIIFLPFILNFYFLVFSTLK